MGTASMTMGQFREFAGAVLRCLPDDLNPTTAQCWIENQESLRKVLREALVPNGKPAGNVYPVVVNYDLPVEDAVKAGKYDWTNESITSKNFPSKRKGTAEGKVILVHFNRDMGTDDVLRELDRMGLRPAELPEGLALGTKYPDIQREFPVVILGSVWQAPVGSRDCAYLDRRVSERVLDLSWIGRRWSDSCRFAAARK